MEWYTCVALIDIGIAYLAWCTLQAVFATFVAHLVGFALVVYAYCNWKPKAWPSFRSLSVWQWFRKQYWLVDVNGLPLDALRPEARDHIYMYAIAPHGLYASGTTIYFGLNNAYQNVVLMASSMLFWIPLLREFSAWGGAQPATRQNIKQAIQNKKDVAIVPESLRGVMHPGKSLEIIKGKTTGKPRTGFIECALDMVEKGHNISIVPLWIQGQDDMYNVWIPFPRLSSFLLRKTYYAWPLFAFGFTWVPFWPKPVKLTYWFGKPIELKRGDKVLDVLDVYCDALQQEMEKANEG